MPIRRLPTLLVNQIAAGEVIERPASVVKELVENSIDAGATRIDVTVEQGGIELVQVADNGGGIPADELPLALAPHATSKIEQATDLDDIATMGFRGEAIASIASVSRLGMRSRPPAEDAAALIEGEGADVGPVRPASGPPGTTVTVRNLFFNTPARRKFLKTPQTENGRVAETMRNLAVANPALGFSLTSDGQRRMELPAGQEPRRRVLAVLGAELEPELLEFSRDEQGLRLWGLAGTPALARSTARHMRVYLNGRVINDRSINHALKEAYRGLIDPTRSPTVVLFIEMDPGQVDVNVHPAKSEVRFRNQSQVHRAVRGAVSGALKAADLVPAFDLARATGGGDPGPRPSLGGGSMPASAFVDSFRRLDARAKGFVYSEVKEALARETPELLRDEVVGAVPTFVAPLEEALPRVRVVQDALQVHASYIVTQDADGMVIIDQHALHERVMFEKLKARVEAGPLESQRLLVPAIIEVDRGQRETFEQIGDLLAALGIEATAEDDTIAVHSFTSLLFERTVDPVSFMPELLATAQRHVSGEQSEAALHEVLDMMACKAAIKAGDRLEPGEIDELLAFRETVERSSRCPHGRPTTLRLSIEDLERQFGRR